MKTLTAPPQKRLLNEFESAAMVGMSPDLLRWFTSYAPKQGIDRKLSIAQTKEDLIFFDEEELRSFDDWLRLPWPHVGGQRPQIPSGIRREIKMEANGACAICLCVAN